MTDCRILLVSGSLRAGSTNSAVLRLAAEVAPSGVEATVFDRMAKLPHFNPDDDVEPLPTAVADLRAAVAAADALLVSTPEYAGALPGSFKNLLDWLVGGMEIARKRVAFINVSSSGGKAAGAHASLRTVLGYIDADVVDGACAHIPVLHNAVAADGTIADPTIRAQVAAAVQTLVTAAASDA